MAHNSATRGRMTRAGLDATAASPEELDRLLVTLAAESAAGDEEALELLLYAVDSQRLAEPGIRRVIFDPDDVDEVSQIVLIAIAERLHTFRAESRFTSWLFGVSRNKALEFLRRKRDNSPLSTDLGEVDRISSMVVNQEFVQTLLSELPDRYRRPVTMRDLNGMAYAEIADDLELNLNTVRAQIARGRALLASRVRGFDHG